MKNCYHSLVIRYIVTITGDGCLTTSKAQGYYLLTLLEESTIRQGFERNCCRILEDKTNKKLLIDFLFKFNTNTSIAIVTTTTTQMSLKQLTNESLALGEQVRILKCTLRSSSSLSSSSVLFIHQSYRQRPLRR